MIVSFLIINLKPYGVQVNRFEIMKPNVVTKEVKEITAVVDGLENKFDIHFDYHSAEFIRLVKFIRTELMFTKKLVPEKYKSDLIDITVNRVYLSFFL